MSKSTFKLYVDELGMSHPKSYRVSPYYILVGCIIDESHQRELEEFAAHIKYKYWGKTDVVFHSTEINRDLNEFAIFKDDPAKKQEFLKDLFEFMNRAPVIITAAVIDKHQALANSWSEKTVIRRSAEVVLFNFLSVLFTKRPCRGHVIIEASNADRDSEYLAAFNRLLSPSFAEQNTQFSDVREHLTSINFATKQNHDIESQVTDLLAYGIRCHTEALHGTKFAAKSYEAKIMKLARAKLVKPIPTMGADKRVFFDEINPVAIMPAGSVLRKAGDKPSPSQKEKRG